MADTQAKQAYAWQHSWLHWNYKSSSDREIRIAIRQAESYYKIPKIKIKLFTKNKNSEGEDQNSYYIYSGYYGNPRIELRPYHQNIPIALHEVAHAICGSIFRDTVENHGKEWLGVFMYLLEKEGIAPVSALHASAREFGLKWVSAEKIGPKMIRKTYKKKLQALATESYRRL